jgi:TetR/AcrR family transcriptional regulator, mexCD-oprJ operon repressor
MRADALRNRDAILDATLRTLNADPGASIAQIAAEAGISRITFYGHFSSRDRLLDAVGERVIDRVDAQLAALDVAGGPWQVLETMIQTQWRLVDELSGFIRAAQEQLPAERIRELHAGPITRIQGLIQAGRDDGSFRTDHSLQWQTTCFFAIIHGAATELRSGRLSEADAAHVIPQTVHALLTPPARP